MNQAQRNKVGFGMYASGAAILIAWHAAFPGQPRSDSTSFADLATQLREKFPFSWGTALMRAESIKGDPTGPDRWETLGKRLRDGLILNGTWHADEFPGLAQGGAL